MGIMLSQFFYYFLLRKNFNKVQLKTSFYKLLTKPFFNVKIKITGFKPHFLNFCYIKETF